MVYNTSMKNDKKTFMYKYNPYSYTLVGIVFALLLLSAIVNFLKYFKVGNLGSYFPELELSIAIISIIFVVALSCFLLLSRYIIKDGRFYVQKVTMKEIPVEKMLYIRVDKTNKLTVLYYADEESENDGISFVVFNLFKKDEEKLIDALQELNSHVSVERV